MPDNQPTISETDLKRRSEAAKEACRIVRKFPQIDQAVLAPLLAREIGFLILRTQEATARECEAIANKLSATAWTDYKRGEARGDSYTEGKSDGAESVGQAIRARYPEVANV